MRPLVVLTRLSLSGFMASATFVEKDGLLTAKELAERVSAYYGSHAEPYLAVPEKIE